MPSLRTLLPCFLLLSSAGACQTWAPQTSPAPQAVGQMSTRGTVRILRHDRALMVVSNPRLVGDSIVGTTGGERRRAAVALADVERIDQRRISGGRTSGLVGGAFGVAALAVAVAALAHAFRRTNTLC